ncbi:hypothetical protein [Nitrosopumilus sp. S4]
MPDRKPFRSFRRKEPSLTTEQKIERFVLRNSKSGFFTRASTLAYKFEISESKSWDIIGELLSSGMFESIHDERTGEMKLCELGKKYEIMDLERKRKREKFRDNKKKKPTD